MARSSEARDARLRRWRRELDRRHRVALRTAFSTRSARSLFRRSAVLRVRLRESELELLELIAREHAVPLATLAWSILSEWLAGVEAPRMAPGLSLEPLGVTKGEADRLHGLVHSTTPGGRFGPRPRSQARRLLRERQEAKSPPTLDETLPPDWWEERFRGPESVTA